MNVYRLWVLLGFITLVLQGSACEEKVDLDRMAGDAKDEMTTYSLTLIEKDRGWWQENMHYPDIQYAFHGFSGVTVYNAYVAFDLSGVTGPVIGAKLRLKVDWYQSPDSFESDSIWDISHLALLDSDSAENSSDTNLAIFQDLQSGIQFGTVTILSTDLGAIVETILNNSGVAAINGALGGAFAVGFHTDTVTYTPYEAETLRFESSDSMINELVLTVLGP
jgi:hypothetical protein